MFSLSHDFTDSIIQTNRAQSVNKSVRKLLSYLLVSSEALELDTSVPYQCVF